MPAVAGPLCSGCPLEHRGTIFIPFDGSGQNRVMLYGDSGWQHEAIHTREMNGAKVGTPFSGPSGWFIERQLKRIRASRQQFVIANALWCKAERLGFTDHADKFPEVSLALAHCAPYTDELIGRMGVKVIVPMGNAALRRVAGVSGIERHHGYYVNTPYGIPAIPTFHPSYIMKGNQKLSGPWCFAVERALRLASGQEKPRVYRELLLDPSLAEARLYFDSGPRELLVCDIETVDTDENEDEREGAGYVIVRISFSNREGTAVSMPWQEPYIGLCKRVLAMAGTTVFWNYAFDVPRLRANGCELPGKIIDAMFAWHWLQSDLPKALAFVAPMFALIEPWKHLNSGQPALYSAIDSAATMDCYLGIRAQLEREGRWEMFDRHCTRMFPLLDKMSAAGMTIDIAQQSTLKARLECERDQALDKLQSQVPDAIKPRKRFKREREGCEMAFDQTTGEIWGWDQVEPFNPASSLQVKSLISHLGLKLPKVHGDSRESTEAKFLKVLSKKNSIFRTILDYRERCKIIDAYMWKVANDGRVHATFSFHPSTWRKSARNPNVQTVPKRNDLAEAFRKMCVAGSGRLLVECDSSAIEAVLVGFFAGSDRYIALAKNGVHKWLASEYAGRKVEKSEPLYDQIKRVVHLSNYRGTPQRMHEEYPDVFASVKDARKLQDFYFATDPGRDVVAWQKRVMEQAHRERSLQNPFKYRHYFYDVFTYRQGQWVMGDDAKRAVAFLPQSTASALQTEYLLKLAELGMDHHVRWLVHDSIIAEVPVEYAETFARYLHGVMTGPIAELGGLAIGAEVKLGPNLASMAEVKL